MHALFRLSRVRELDLVDVNCWRCEWTNLWPQMIGNSTQIFIKTRKIIFAYFTWGTLILIYMRAILHKWSFLNWNHHKLYKKVFSLIFRSSFVQSHLEVFKAINQRGYNLKVLENPIKRRRVFSTFWFYREENQLIVSIFFILMIFLRFVYAYEQNIISLK